MTNKEQALEFLGSMRGQYIMGQALQLAIESLESVEPEVMRELSNISDMKLIRDNLFSMGAAVSSKEAKEETERLRQEFISRQKENNNGH